MDRAREIELCRRWRAGAGEQFDELWEEFLKPIRPIVVRQCSGSAVEADDVLQDTAETVCQHIRTGRYRPGGSARLRTYCTSIAINKARSRIAQDRRRYGLLGRWRRRSPDGPETPDQIVSHKEECLLLIEGIKSLPDTPHRPLRRIFLLCEGLRLADDQLEEDTELTQSEVGDRFGRSRSWVSQKYTEATALLARRLGQKLDMR